MHPLSSRLLTISQALRAGRPSVTFAGPHFSKRSSKQRQILNILAREGFFCSACVERVGNAPSLTVSFAYTSQGLPVLRRLYAISKPSRRVYLPSAALWQSRGQQGIFLVSTPAGILTDSDARRQNLGGEVLLGVI